MSPRFRRVCLSAAVALGGFALCSGAAPADSRIREVAFDPASVVSVATALGVTTMVQFAPGEHVRTVAAGQGADCAQVLDPWCVSWPAEATFLFVRARTRAKFPLSLAVVTDRHAYSLEFNPAPLRGETPVHRLVFTYEAVSKVPDAPARSAPAGSSVGPAQPLLPEPVPANSDYSIALGPHSEELAPSLVFDDGRFTYLKWPGNREIPAVFEIRADGTEAVVNTRMQGDLLVVDRVARGLMLRAGSAVASLRNESFDPEGVPPVKGTTAPGLERFMRE